jgi:hypothetical protein
LRCASLSFLSICYALLQISSQRGLLFRTRQLCSMAAQDGERSIVDQSGNISQVLGLNNGVGAVTVTGGTLVVAGRFTGAVLHAASAKLATINTSHKFRCLFICIFLP